MPKNKFNDVFGKKKTTRNKKRRLENEEVEKIEGGPINLLPSELMPIIFGWLDNKSLGRTALVCHHFKLFADSLLDDRHKKSVENVRQLIFETQVTGEDEDLEFTNLNIHLECCPENFTLAGYTYDLLLEQLAGLHPLRVFQCLLKKINQETIKEVNPHTKQGLLHYFIGTFDVEIVRALLEAGCKVNQGNRYNETPIHILFSVLLEKEKKQPGVNKDVPSIELIELLLEHKASFNIGDDGWEDDIQVGILSDFTRQLPKCPKDPHNERAGRAILSQGSLEMIAFLYTKKAFIGDLNYEGYFITDLALNYREQYLSIRQKIFDKEMQKSQAPQEEYQRRYSI